MEEVLKQLLRHPWSTRGAVTELELHEDWLTRGAHDCGGDGLEHLASLHLELPVGRAVVGADVREVHGIGALPI